LGLGLVTLTKENNRALLNALLGPGYAYNENSRGVVPRG